MGMQPHQKDIHYIVDHPYLNLVDSEEGAGEQVPICPKSTEKNQHQPDYLDKIRNLDTYHKHKLKNGLLV